MDQYLVAAFFAVAFLFCGVLAYVLYEEKQSHVVIEKPPEPDTVETRSRRAF